MTPPRRYVVMGVGGSGKSTVAEELARAMDGDYRDADDFHPQSNREKLNAGVPLTDDDRRPWLDALNALLRADADRPIFLACSALKQSYRDRLAAGVPGGVRFVFLRVDREAIRARLNARKDHPIFKSSDSVDAFVASQFATLEEPADAVTIDVDDAKPADAVIAEAVAAIRR